MILGIMLNHGIMLDEKGDYLASSPDELSLLNGAKFMGVTLVKQNLSELHVKIKGKVRVFKILFKVEFSSERKRMTTVVQDEQGRIRVFCKGADTICFPLLHPKDALRNKTESYLDEYARHGLRTLLFMQKDITQEAFNEWHDTYQKAACLTGKMRDDAVDKAHSMLERDFKICGSTAIEDRLQFGVPEAIKHIKNAGIKLWILTGDKIETAINIGFSCNVLEQGQSQVIIDGQNSNDIYTQLRDAEKVAGMFALIISGDSLLKIQRQPFFQ